jgi:hypothetical protein
VGVTYATGFGGYTSGAEPPDWTQTSGAFTWTVSTDSNALYGKSAAITAFTSNGFKTWNAVPSTADVEILLISKLPASITTGDPFLRPSGRVDATGANGYFADWQLISVGNLVLNIFKRVSGTNTGIGSIAKTFSAGDVVAMRFRVVGTALSLKAWLWSAAEPGSWDISITDSAVTAAGLVGIRKAAATQTDAYYWFSVATGGDTAPSPFFPGTGSFTLAGQAVAFRVQEPAALASFALTGQAAKFQAAAGIALGTFALTGRAATFQAQFAAPFAAFTLGGPTPALQVKVPAALASFALAGGSTTFDTYFALTVGAFNLAGQVFFDPVEVVAPGSFMLTGYDVDLSYDLLGGGSSISGGTFSRQRWREMLAEEERRRAEEARHIRDEKLRRKGERRRREAALAEARRRSRERARARADAEIAALVAEHAAAAARSVEDLKALAAQASAQARAAQAARAVPSTDDDEEEAIALLLLAHAHR